jgi:hypothetical protein
MGGGDKGSAASAQSSQQLLDEFKKQQTASQIQGAFNQLGKGIGTQLPYMQAPGDQQASPAAVGPQGGASPLAATGPIFQGMAGGGGGGGIDPQQLAMILQRLGYGG